MVLPVTSARATTFSLLYSFQGVNAGDGANPQAGLIADKAGNLYGTTIYGGGVCGNPGCGTVFRRAPDGTNRCFMHSWAEVTARFPSGALLAGKAGNFYGAAGGGTAGMGSIYKLAPDGTESVLYSFKGGSDGVGPNGGLISERQATYTEQLNLAVADGCLRRQCDLRHRL